MLLLPRLVAAVRNEPYRAPKSTLVQQAALFYLSVFTKSAMAVACASFKPAMPLL